MTRTVRLAAAAAILAAAIAPAAAASIPKAPLAGEIAAILEPRQIAAAPAGAAVLCRRAPEVCAPRPARGVPEAQGRILPDPAVLFAVLRVNQAVNRSIAPRRDGPKDVWTLGAAAGDCEDYALEKRARLLALGLPSSALLLATARTPRRNHHAVLIVRTTAGDLVLDNRTRDVATVAASDLAFRSMQSDRDPRLWRIVAPKPIPATIEPTGTAGGS